MGMYFRTVRGETRTPSLTSSSWAILSSPHVMFATAISAISFFSSSGSVGRPFGRDFQRHNRARKVHRSRGHNKAAIAVANKLARIVWAVSTRESEFQSVPAAA